MTLPVRQFSPLAPPPLPSASMSEEHRRYQRVRVDLLGRYMLQDRREYTCQVSEMSPGGAVLIAPHTGRIDEKVIAYIDNVGRLEGYIRRTYPGGFTMSVETSPAKREKLAEQLTWLANRTMLGMSDDRSAERVEPNRSTISVMPLGQPRVTGKVVNISATGIAIEANTNVQAGDIVYVGKVLARVVRPLGYGFAAEFAKHQTNANLFELAAELGVEQLFAGGI